MLCSDETYVNIMSAITQKNLDNVPKKFLYVKKLISRQNAKNVTLT